MQRISTAFSAFALAAVTASAAQAAPLVPALAPPAVTAPAEARAEVLEIHHAPYHYCGWTRSRWGRPFYTCWWDKRLRRRSWY